MTEHHTFEPFLPANARVLIFGLIFFHDNTHFLIEEEKRFDLDAIKEFLNEKGIALFDTATDIIRTKNTA